MTDMRTRPLLGPVRPLTPETTLKNSLGNDGGNVLGNSGMATAQLSEIETLTSAAHRPSSQPSFIDLLQRSNASSATDRLTASEPQHSAENGSRPRTNRPASETEHESARRLRTEVENSGKADRQGPSRTENRKTDEADEADESKKRKPRNRVSEKVATEPLTFGAEAAPTVLTQASVSDQTNKPQPAQRDTGKLDKNSGNAATTSPRDGRFASQAAFSPLATPPQSESGPASSTAGQWTSTQDLRNLTQTTHQTDATKSVEDTLQRFAAHSAGGKPYVLSTHLQRAFGLSNSAPVESSQITTPRMTNDALDPNIWMPRSAEPLLFSQAASTLTNPQDPSVSVMSPSSMFDHTRLNGRNSLSERAAISSQPGANEIIDQMNQVQTASPSAAQRFAELAQGFDKVDFVFHPKGPDAFSGPTTDQEPDAPVSLPQGGSQATPTPFAPAPSTAVTTGPARPAGLHSSTPWSSTAPMTADGGQVLQHDPGLSPDQALSTPSSLAKSLQNDSRSSRIETQAQSPLTAYSSRQSTVRGRGLRNENLSESHINPSWADAPSQLTGTRGADFVRTAGLPGKTPLASGGSDDHQVQHQISQSALRLADQLAARGTGTARLSIQDGATGTVDIVVNLDHKSGLTIQIQAESDETRRRIESQIDTIRENLESQNFRSVDVRLSSEGTSGKHDGNQSQQHSSQQSASSEQQQNQQGSLSGDGRGNNRERAHEDRLFLQNSHTAAEGAESPRSNGPRAQYATQGMQSINEKGRINVRA